MRIGLLSLLKGSFTFLWETDFEGPEYVALLPIYFETPVIAIALSLELESCGHTSG